MVLTLSLHNYTVTIVARTSGLDGALLAKGTSEVRPSSLIRPLDGLKRRLKKLQRPLEGLTMHLADLEGQALQCCCCALIKALEAL